MNLLDKTLDILYECNLPTSHIEWVGAPSFGWFTWDEFVAVAKNTYYDAGYGAPEIATDLVISGNDGWWLTRDEYDGSECWVLHKKPARPRHHVTPTRLKIPEGGEEVGWRTLLECHVPEV